MEKNLLKKLKSSINPNIMFFDGLDDAIVGIAHRNGFPSVLCYNSDLIVDLLSDKYGKNEAIEKFANLVNGVTEDNVYNYPVFLEDIEHIKNEE